MRKRIMSALLVLALCLSLAPTAALADEPAEAPESALTEETALPEDGTTEETEPEEETAAPDPGNDPADDMQVDISWEVVDLGDLETCADTGISLFSVETGAPDLKEDNYTNWIDRVILPDYAVDFYDALAEGADNDGTDDILIEDTYFETGTADPGSPDTYSALNTGDVLHTSTGSSIFVTKITETDQTKVEQQKTYALACVAAAYNAFDRDHPEVFWLGNSSYANCQTFTYKSGNAFTKAEIYVFFSLKNSSDFDLRDDQYQGETLIKNDIAARDQHINSILGSDFPIGGSDVEKITYFNKWLTTHNEYNTYVSGGQSSSAPRAAWECTSALEGRTGGDGPVCEGYARAFKVLCDEVGIPCVLVDGHAKNSADSDGEAHMWNYVQMGDNWYAVDVTWNDPTGGNSGALSGVENENWLLVGGTTVVKGMEFLTSHPVANKVSQNGIGFTNGPVLSNAKYTPPAPEKTVTRAEMAEQVSEKLNTHITGGSGVSANFKDIGSCTQKQQEAINRLYSAQILTGTGADTFDPDGTVTRAQAAVIIWRAAGSRSNAEPVIIPYSDVISSAWYAAAINCLYAMGVLTADDAVSGTAFGLDLAVSQKDLGNWLSQCAAALNNGSINMIAPAGGATRAEMAEQVYNDYRTLLADMTLAEGRGEDKPLPFTDIDGCTEAQKTAIEFFYRRGIISGTTETTFTPYAAASNAQIAVFLYKCATAAAGGAAADAGEETGLLYAAMLRNAGEWYEDAVQFLIGQGTLTLNGNKVESIADFNNPNAPGRELVTWNNGLKPAAPTISSEDGMVTITAEDGAVIYYTTDGIEPTIASTRYTGAFSAPGATVKAVAVKNNMLSAVAEVTVGQAAVTPVVTTAPTAAATYGDTLNDVSITGGAVKAGDDADAAEVSGSWSWKAPVPKITKAGTMTATAVFTPTDTTAYKAVECTVTVTVAKAELTAESATVADKVYDGYTAATVTGVTFSGLKNGETLTLGTDYTAEGSFNTTQVGSGKSVTVTVTLGSTAAAGNYSLSGNTVTTTASITPAPLTSVSISGVAAPVTGGTPVTADAVTVGGGAATVTSLVWKTGDVEFNGTTFGASTVYSVEITLNAANGNSFAQNITCADYEVRFVNNTQIVLTKTFPATAEKTLTGLSVSENRVGNKTHGDTVAKDELTVAASYDDGSTDAAFTDYEIVYTSGTALKKGDTTFTIRVGDVSVSVTIPAVQGKALDADAFDVTGLRALELIYNGSDQASAITAAVSAMEGVGACTYSLKKNGADVTEAKDAGAYTLCVDAVEGEVYAAGTMELGTVTVLPKALTDSDFTMGENPVYTGAPISAPVTTSLTKGTDYTVSGAESLTDVAASAVTVTFTGTGNYSGTITRTWNLEKAALTLSVSVETKTYDGTSSAAILPGALAGKMGTDDVSVAEASISGTFADANAGTGKAVTGTGVFTLAGAKAGNYTLIQPDLTYLTGTIEPCTTVTDATNQTQTAVRGDGAFALPVITGVNGEAATGNITYTYDGGTKTAEEVKTALAGSAAGATAAIGYTFAGTGNYAGASVSGTITVTVVDVAFTVDGAPATADNAVTLKADPTYGDTWAQIVTINTITAKVGDQTGAGTYRLDVTGAPDAGEGQTFQVLYSGTIGGRAYTDVVVVSGTVDVAKKAVTVTGLTAENKVYDGTTDVTVTGTAAISGAVLGDALTLTPGTAAFGDENVGTGKAVTLTGYALSGDKAANYTLTLPSLTADITAKPVTITGLGAADKVYDGDTSAVMTGAAVIDGVISGDTVSVVQGTAAFASPNAGTGIAVTFSGFSLAGADAGNYILSAQPASVTANITKDTSTAAPAAGEGYTLDYAAETIAVDSGYEVSTASDGTGTPVSGGSVTAYLGQTLYIRKVEDQNHAASGWTAISLASRPAAPGLVKTDETVKGKGDGRITGITEAMEYRIGAGAWISGPADLTDLAAGTAVTVRIKAAAAAPHGEEASNTIAAGPAITVTFDSKGGSAVSAAADLSYGGKAARPADPTREDYAFQGWYKDAACTAAWDFETDTVAEDITLYAGWKQVRFSVGVTVKDQSGNPVADADVTLKRGSIVLETGRTNASGAYAFTGHVPAGAYNIVVSGTSGGEQWVKTSLVTITDRDETVTVTKPTEGANSHLDVSTGTPNVVVGGLDDEAEKLIQGTTDTKVTVSMTVEAKAESQADGAAQIRQTAAAGTTNWQYLAIEVTKTVVISGTSTDAAVSETQTVMEIVVPFDFGGKSDVAVYRYHDGSAAKLNEAAGGTEGTYQLDRANGLIHIFAGRFSTYAIGYKDETATPVTPSGGHGGSSVTTYAVSVDSGRNGTVTVSPRNASRGTTVTITVKPDAGYALDALTVTTAGGAVKVTKKSDTKYTFSMPSGKVTVEATFTEIAASDGLVFTDVPRSAYYRDAVAWAVEQGITGGTTDDTFSPNVPCTRAQTVTFLWRAAGCPEAAGSVNPFTDVAESAYYYQAVLWAVERGITTGSTATTFSPNAVVTRGQTMTFLYRAIGRKTAGSNPFTDVADSAYYADAVKWAVAESITGGITADTFGPAQPCTRAQIVTFLYRAMAEQ